MSPKCRTVYDNDFHGSRWRKWLPEGHVALEDVMFAPLALDGKAVGVIGVANKPGGFNEDDARMATALGELCAIALRNSKTLGAVRESEQKFHSLLDALPVSIVTLSAEGRITSVNEAWKRFALDNGLEDPRSVGVGVSYLDVCRRAAVEGEPSARDALAGLEAIFKGHSRAFSLEYPCPSPDAQRWFLMRAIPMDIACRQVALIHMDITQRKLAENILLSQRDELEKRVRERTEELARANRELKQEMEIRKSAEQSLRESEERYRRITQSITDYVYTVRVEGGVPVETIHNPECEAITRYSSEELSADPFLWLLMVDEKDRDKVLEYSNKILAGIDTEPIEHVIIRKDGERRWVRNTAVPHRDLQGNLVSYDGLLQDITRGKSAEEQLRQSEEKYRGIFEHSGLGIFQSSLERRFISANSSLARIFGYESPEDLMASVHDIADQVYASPQVRDQVGRCLAASDTAKLEIAFRRRDQTTGATFLHMRAVRDNDGRLLRFEGFVEDITERKRAEERIRESKETLQTVCDGISEPMIMMDQDGLVKMLNNAALNYFHLNEYTDALGKLCFEAFFGRSAPCQGCARPFSALRDYAGEFERQGVMEPDRLEQVVVYGVKDHTGEQRAAIVRINDITQARIMERQLAQSEKLAALGLLVSSIAHEINNPNNFIVFNLPILRDYLEMLMPLVDDYMEDQPNLELFGMSYEEFRKDIFRLLENMEYGSQRINATVCGLKDFAQKRDNLERHSVDLKQVIEGAMALCHGEIRQRVKSFDVDIPEDILPIHADAKAVEQVLINLLINAAHAADKEDSWIRLHILQEGGLGCVIEVSDNGCGMDEKTMDNIFDPFFTTKSSMMGTGLGLHVCRNLVERLGGRIEVESKPGEGSTFRVVLGNS